MHEGHRCAGRDVLLGATLETATKIGLDAPSGRQALRKLAAAVRLKRGRGCRHRYCSALHIVGSPICAKLFWPIKRGERIVTRREFIAFISSAAAIRPLGARAERPPERVLYFTYSAGYRHDVLPLSEAILTQLGRNSGAFEVIATEDLSEISTGNLDGYSAVMFYTTGEIPISAVQKTVLLNFVRSGRGFLGIHSAADTFYTWADYLDLIGGYFNGHPWHQDVTIEVADAADPLVAFLGNSLQLNDEIYQISDFDYRGSRVLLRLDQSSVDLGKADVHRRFYGWPLAWKRFFGDGRVFYSALGHEASVWQDPRYQRLLTNAILWSTGRLA
jgi:type 1 glutamine amidotransferase